MSANEAMIEYRFSGFRLDVWQRKLFNAEGEIVSLSSRAMDALLLLLAYRGETLSKSQMMQAVWPNVVVEENNLNQAISSLRKALGDTKGDNNFILTVPLRGYCFVAPVEVSRLSAPGAVDAAVITEPVSAPEVVSMPVPAVPRKLPFLPLAMFVLLLVAGTVFYLFNDPDLQQQGGAGFVPEATASITPAPAASEIIRNSIAVLPFTILSPDDNNKLFAVGLHDEVINQLTKIRSLNVISRNSVMALVDQKLSMTDIGRRLRVESIMSGTFMVVGEQARISLQMLDASTGITLWAETYEANQQDLAEMVSIQSDIAVHVASALKAEIEQSEHDVIATLPTSSFEAYRYNLAATYARMQQEFVKEWHLSKRALELDPTYFDALESFSTVNSVLVAAPLSGMSSHDHFALALQTAEKMIEIAPGRSEGYSLKAVALGTSGDWANVSDALQTLAQMQVPAYELKYVALILLCLGDFDKSIEIYEAGLITEPVNFYGRGFLMGAYELVGDQEKARQEYMIGEELSPVWWGDTINIFLALGRHEPLEDIDDLMALSAELKHVLMNINDAELVKAGLRAFQASENKIATETIFYGAIAAYIGDDELAVVLMKDALDEVWTAMYWLWFPVFDETRKLASFRELLLDSGVVGYWQKAGWPKVCQPVGESFTCDWTAYP